MTDVIRLPSKGKCRTDEQCFYIEDMPLGFIATPVAQKLNSASPDPVFEFSERDRFCMSIPDGTTTENYLVTVTLCPAE